MGRKLFGEELKTRISLEQKTRLETEAEKQGVKTSHLARTAVREFLDRHAPVLKAKRRVLRIS